ncbi:unnamed protein product [Vitrella brassicaformis CCMP3155]|uniref:Prefoldin subunit 6 n=2 Tax=Vitrella brassicaformis TaxID=1169539 RepID=A0A0G4EZF1_VITBC|nr:unnamed protein product [Vitrella brassicaformis CCMP3155]|eukprot:CEM04172.1 unnamed protein product [Vitrella brassicaformis CCMP3155]
MASEGVSAPSEKELQEIVKLYKKTEEALREALMNREKLIQQQSENKMVKEEFGCLESDAEVYKLVGPLLVKQPIDEAKTQVDKRLDYIDKEIERAGSIVEGLQTTLKECEQKVAAFESAKQQAAQPQANTQTAAT